MGWYDDVYNAVLTEVAVVMGAEYTPPPPTSPGTGTGTGGATPGSGTARSCQTQPPRQGGSTYWRSVQQKLCNLGYDPGVIDGVVGSNTRGAIRMLQGAVGLPVTGRVDAATGPRLNAVAEAAPSGGEGTRPSPTIRRENGDDPTPPPSAFARFFNPSNPTMWMTLAGVLLMGGGVAYGVVRYRKSQVGQLPGATPPARLSAESMPPTLVQDDLAGIKAQLATGA